MSSKSEDPFEVLLEFSGVLQLKLPLDHFSQFYDQHHLNNVAQEEAKEILMNFQKNSKLNMEETLKVVNELFPKLQEVIQGWKVKNVGNKTQCDLFLQSQVDFLISEFRTSVMIKLISTPDVSLENLETFLEGRKIVLIDIFEKLSKPGEPQSSFDMKTRLDEKLECIKMETLEKQRHHLEHKTTEKAGKVLQDAKEITMELARELKSELESYKGQNPKDLVKEKLEDIDYNLRKKCKELEDHHPNIYSSVLRSTAEVRKCLDEKDYEHMRAEEFAETLFEQLLYDFSGESQIGQNSSVMEFDSVSSSDDDDGTCPISSQQQKDLLASERNEIYAKVNEAREDQPNVLQIDIVEKERIKEESDNGEAEVDQDTNRIDPRNSSIEAALVQFRDDGENSEEEEENEEAESSKTPHDNFVVSRGNLNNSKRGVSNSIRNSFRNNSSRRSDRVQNSSKPVAEKRLRRTRRCVVKKTKKLMDDDKCSGSGSEDCEHSTIDESDKKEIDRLPQKRIPIASSNGSKLRQTGKRRLSVEVKGNAKTETITYLHLAKCGRPMYRCNVCDRKCFQSRLKYHGENCGTSDDPLACTECGNTFMKKSHLDMHVRIHTGEKPFKCSKCPEKFAQKGNLTRHIRSHIRGTRFFCKACKLLFISQHRLHDHNKTMHRWKLPFGCMYCDEYSLTMAQLKNHVIVSHAGLRPLRCPTCDFVASSKDDLAKHIQRTHSQSRDTAQKLAIEAAIAYLVEDTKDESYQRMPERKINSLVVSHIIKKANLKLPKGSTRARKSADHPSTS